MYLNLKNFLFTVMAALLTFILGFGVTQAEITSCTVEGELKAQLPSIPTFFSEIIKVQVSNDESNGYVKCNSKNNTITDSQWKILKDRIWRNPLLRNSYPEGLCFSRSTVLSKFLDEAGFGSEKIMIYGNILPILQTVKGFQALSYNVHQANIITRVDKNGNEEKHVVDPMFSEDSIPLEEYLDQIKVNGHSLKFSIVDQTFEPRLENSFQVPADYDASKVDCKYSRLDLASHNVSLEEAAKNAEQLTRDYEIRASFPTKARARAAYLEFYGHKPDPGTIIKDSMYQDDVVRALRNRPNSQSSIENFLRSINQ